MPVIHKHWRSYLQTANYEEEIKKPKERILLILRAHPITNLGWLLSGTVLILLPLVFGNYLASANLKPNQELFITLFYYGLIFAYLLNKFYFWYFAIGVVTNRKIIDVDVNNLLNSNTTATTVAKVEEVEKRSLGIAASIFNYGDVYIQTAGETPNVEFLKIPEPAKVVKIINLNMRAYGNNRYSPSP